MTHRNTAILRSHQAAVKFAARAAGLSFLFATLLAAGQTHIWTQSDYSDFEKGVLKNLSVRSDGLLSLAPHSREVLDTSAAYLWALARDSKGNLYAAGAGAKIYRVSPDSRNSAEKPKPIADLDALGIQALALDSSDRLYAATAPDGKVYRIANGAKPEVFYEPKAKYIWAMTFNKQGDLFIATGDPGGIDRVAPNGKGGIFFKTGETHVRSLALDANQNLIAGTDPGGLVLRVTPQGAGFVLYQMSKPEVTAVAVAHDGAIYAAAVGTKGAVTPSMPIAAPAAATVVVNAPGSAPAGQPAPAPRPSVPAMTPSAGVPGGSEVYRISPDGYPMKVWSQSQDVVYAIAFDAGNHPLLGSGNRGNLYRIESPNTYTSLLTMPVSQITAFQSAPDGRIYAATANIGKVIEIGPAMEREGSIESDVFDASLFSLWGRLSFEAHLRGGEISIQTRSGNLDQPQENWSAWSAPITSSKGAPITSPAARFVQWKATLRADNAGQSPELESVDVAYLAKNVAPRIDQIEITPPNYKFPAPLIPLIAAGGPPATLNLPPLGRQSSVAPPVPMESGGSAPAMTYSKGYVGARWGATDPNGDALTYTVEIRGEKETAWKPLKQNIPDRYFSFDSTAFPDGDYRLRVTASDAPGNPPADTLTGAMESDPFTIDNTPPAVTALAASRNGGRLEVRWHAADALSNITKAEYSVDGGEWTVAAPVTKLSDSPQLDYSLSLDAAPGEHTVAVRVTDDYGNIGIEKVVAR